MISTYSYFLCDEKYHSHWSQCCKILNWSFDYEPRLSDNVIEIPEELDLWTTGKYFYLTFDRKIDLLIV